MTDRIAMASAAGENALARTMADAEDKLLACIHCGFCLPACPTYTRLGDEADSPRGRLHLMRAVAEGRLEPDAAAFAVHIDRCLGCRACETVCPSGVEYGFLLERARAVILEATGQRWAAAALLWIMASPVLASIGLALARALRAVRVPRLLLRITPRQLSRIRFGLAMLAATSAWPGLRRQPGAAIARAAAGASRAPRPRVALLAGCVQQGLYARVNRATRKVLDANGCHVVPAPAQRCCGALHAHAGDLDRARALARANIRALEAARADAVVVNAAGCGAAMKEYGDLLREDPEYADRARSLSRIVRDLAEFLTEIDIVPGGELDLRVAYDEPCHLVHAQRIRDAPLEMLRAVPGLDVVSLPNRDECCGGAGIYGLLHPELAGRILDDKLREVRAAGVRAVVTPNPGCMMQIGAGLAFHGEPLPVLHPVELLAESYRRAGR